MVSACLEVNKWNAKRKNTLRIVIAAMNLAAEKAFAANV